MSLAGGLLLSLAFPPAEIWPLAFVAVAPLLWLLRSARARRGALLGFIYGVGFYGATLYWILRFGELAWVGLVTLSALSVALVGLVGPAVIREGRPLRTAVGLAALWTLVDWIRGMWPLGGFTWGSLGISQVDDRVLLPLAGLAGVWGVTFVVAAVNALLVETAVGGGGGRRRAALPVLAAALIVAPVLVPFPEPNGGPLDVAVVQVDVRVPPGTDGLEEDRIVAERNIEVHRSLAGSPRPDLVLWGEGALDPGASSDPATVQAVRSAIAQVGAPAAIGAVVDDPDGREFTSALIFDGSGRLIGRYDKVHLVPFGEYVPWRSKLDWISATEQIPVDRTPGDSVHTLATPGVPPFGTPICFENSFPDLPRDFVRDGATFLVVPVNNASYGFTAASDQHLQMSRMRAVETGRWIVDAAVSGVSAFVDTHGRVVARTGLFQTTILRDRLRTSTATTWYVRMGDWLPWLCLVLLVALLLVPRRRSTVRPAPAPLPTPLRALAVLPTYEERETIQRVIEGLLGDPTPPDIVVVDDSSPDGTGDIVRTIAADEPRVRLLERPAKSGLASAYLEGFRLALSEGYDVAIEMDSDLSHDPAELASLLRAADAHDLTVGSRYVAGGTVTNWSRSRVALSRAGNAYARFMLGVPIHDATSGYRVYRREVLEALLATPFASDGYGFQIELVMRAHRLGFDVGESPISFREREHGRSKISRGIVVEALWHVTRWGWSLRFGHEPPGMKPG
ncbi:MAG TPA: apolipoprotein N-acyltransferase [Actinomycetota bacterium]|nr:apolipoprotein N-acyltransferase [Actinomycetota bacterium]